MNRHAPDMVNLRETRSRVLSALRSRAGERFEEMFKGEAKAVLKDSY